MLESFIEKELNEKNIKDEFKLKLKKLKPIVESMSKEKLGIRCLNMMIHKL